MKRATNETSPDKEAVVPARYFMKRIKMNNEDCVGVRARPTRSPRARQILSMSAKSYLLSFGN